MSAIVLFLAGLLSAPAAIAIAIMASWAISLVWPRAWEWFGDIVSGRRKGGGK